MEQTEFIKYLIAAVVGGVLKELVSWFISFTKVSLFGPMWKYNRNVLTDILAGGFYVVLLVRFGITEAAVTRIDVLIVIGCAFGLLVCAISLLINIVKLMSARESATSSPPTPAP